MYNIQIQEKVVLNSWNWHNIGYGLGVAAKACLYVCPLIFL